MWIAWLRIIHKVSSNIFFIKNILIKTQNFFSPRKPFVFVFWLKKPLVIDYHNSVIDYKQLFLAMLLSGNRSPYLCNRLQCVPAPIYSNFKFWNLQLLFLSKTLAPNFSSIHISLNSCPNHSPQSPNFIFFKSLSFEPIEIPKNSSNGGTIEKAERHFESESTAFRGTGNLNAFLHSLWIIVQRNSVYSTQTSFPLVPL